MSDQGRDAAAGPFTNQARLRAEYSSQANYAHAERLAQAGDPAAVAWLQKRLEWLERQHALHSNDE